jgi:NTE family protein
VAIPAGAWLMRDGKPADSLYVVRSGRLAVMAEGPPETLVRMLRRGEVVGELALLRAGTRSASVRTHRDTGRVSTAVHASTR